MNKKIAERIKRKFQNLIMLAAILFKSKQKLRIEEISIPEKLEYGQVLVKIFYSSICGAQLNEIDAAKEKTIFYRIC